MSQYTGDCWHKAGEFSQDVEDAQQEQPVQLVLCRSALFRFDVAAEVLLRGGLNWGPSTTAQSQLADAIIDMMTQYPD
jgi:hypothetical protein